MARAVLALSAFVPLWACGTDSPLAPAIEVPEAPIITGLEIASVAATRATVTWSIDSPALSVVEYGTTEAYGQSAATGTAPDMNHEIILDGLEPSTTYHLRVTAQDRAGTMFTTRTSQFRTAEATSVPDPVDSAAVRADRADVSVDSVEVPDDPMAAPADTAAAPGGGPSVLPVWLGRVQVSFATDLRRSVEDPRVRADRLVRIGPPVRTAGGEDGPRHDAGVGPRTHRR